VAPVTLNPEAATMSDASSTDTPASTDPETRLREGQEAENARMREETDTFKGKTTGSVPWAEDPDESPEPAPRSKKRPAPTADTKTEETPS
jgi:hypothetical protein